MAKFLGKVGFTCNNISHLPIHFSAQCNLVFITTGQLKFSNPGKQWKPTYQVYCMHFHWESLQHDPFDPFFLEANLKNFNDTTPS